MSRTYNVMFAFQRASELFAMAAADAPTDARTWLNWALLEKRRDHYGPARRSVKLPSHCHKCLASTIQLV